MLRISDVRLSLADPADEPCLAYGSFTLDDCFVVRDVRLIEGTSGLFLSLPDRKLTDRCPKCRAKVVLTHRYCGRCGREVDPGRAKGQPLTAPVAFPIDPRAREAIELAVIEVYQRMKEQSPRAKAGQGHG